jgi:hypothetical protein
LHLPAEASSSCLSLVLDERLLLTRMSPCSSAAGSLLCAQLHARGGLSRCTLRGGFQGCVLCGGDGLAEPSMRVPRCALCGGLPAAHSAVAAQGSPPLVAPRSSATIRWSPSCVARALGGGPAEIARGIGALHAACHARRGTFATLLCRFEEDTVLNEWPGGTRKASFGTRGLECLSECYSECFWSPKEPAGRTEPDSSLTKNARQPDSG